MMEPLFPTGAYSASSVSMTGLMAAVMVGDAGLPRSA